MTAADALAPPPVSLLSGAALFLDFDGTLVEVAETPDAITVPAAMPSLLKRLAKHLDGRLAIVSGRALADLERHLDCTGVAVSGSHGLELRLRDGSHVALSVPMDLKDVQAAVKRFAATAQGLLVEEKPKSIALHYRKAPAEEERTTEFMTNLARKSGLSLQRGKMVLELRPQGADKGDAVRALMSDPEFAGARPLFVGDDLTDEDAFEAVLAMGGGGVLVGPPRTTAARWRLGDVAAVEAWLNGAMETVA